MIITYVPDCDALVLEIEAAWAAGKYMELKGDGDLLFTGNTCIPRNGTKSLALVYDMPWMRDLIAGSSAIEILGDSEDPFADVFADATALAKYLSVYPVEEPFATTSSIMIYRAELARIAAEALL